jgi:transcriptional regulator
MYIPKVFSENRLDVLHDFIRNHPLALVVTSDYEANLIPMSLYNEGEKGTLRCHLARGNTQLESLRNAKEVLLVFTGSHGYVTPEVYPSKKTHGKAVPTWNYSMVQVRGKPNVIDDTKWVLRQIKDLTEQMEQDRPQPWAVSDAPEEYIQSQLKLIVGVEIVITQIDGKFKVSQNQSDENRQGVETFFRDICDNEMTDFISNRGAKNQEKNKC